MDAGNTAFALGTDAVREPWKFQNRKPGIQNLAAFLLALLPI